MKISVTVMCNALRNNYSFCVVYNIDSNEVNWTMVSFVFQHMLVGSAWKGKLNVLRRV